MGNFRRDNNRFGGDRGRGGGRGFGGGRNFGRRDDRPREMFKTVCDNCKNDCEVPFKPTSGKPVYCSDCFEKMGNGNNDRRGRQSQPSHSGQAVDYSNSFKELNEKLDKLISLLSVKEKKTKKVAPTAVVVDDEQTN